jgi:hypothetical protein
MVPRAPKNANHVPPSQYCPVQVGESASWHFTIHEHFRVVRLVSVKSHRASPRSCRTASTPGPVGAASRRGSAKYTSFLKVPHACMPTNTVGFVPWLTVQYSRLGIVPVDNSSSAFWCFSGSCLCSHANSSSIVITVTASREACSHCPRLARGFCKHNSCHATHELEPNTLHTQAITQAYINVH